MGRGVFPTFDEKVTKPNNEVGGRASRAASSEDLTRSMKSDS